MVTVEWNAAAYDDSTLRCLDAKSQKKRDPIRRTMHQMNRLLKISPETAGEKIMTVQMEPATKDDPLSGI